MEPRAVIAAIRDGMPVIQSDLVKFVEALSDGRVSDAQVGAFAMAVLLQGLDGDGRQALTLAMRDSGETMAWSHDVPVVDKHSTGGIGDCVSLLLAPALAACGAIVPMISGRGLGHTGGTLDKLEAIPGLITQLETPRLRHVVKETGLVIAAASASVAPADKRLYAVRDVSATVESLDLITASILSKKLAAGLGALVLDVKLGSGAFMKDMGQAQALAGALVDTANATGCKTSALITDMNQPLAPSAGNALEVAIAMKALTGEARGRLIDLTCHVGGEALTLAGLAENADEGAERIMDAIQSGAAAERFGKMIAMMGGSVRFVDAWQRFLPEAPVIRECNANKSGYVVEIDTEALGHSVIALGGGRQIETDTIDPAVGLSDIVSIGERVDSGQPLLRIHASRFEHADRAEIMVKEAIKIGPEPVAHPKLIHARVGL